MLFRFYKSLGYAWKGLRYVAREERNFRVELMIALVLVAVVQFVPVSVAERATLVLSVAFVLVLEMINTVVERMMNALKPGFHPYARVVKDIMAGAVLLASLSTLIIGLWIFIPPLFRFFSV